MRLATRGSALALVQAEQVAAALGGAEVITVRSDDGDVGDKARFVRGVERALLDGTADLGVHSAKDLPGELPAGLELVGVPAREDPADAFVGSAASLAELPEGARVGTASLRRRSQLLAQRPDIAIVELRGNVDTRLRRLAEGDADGLVLAAAGLTRLGREGEIAFRLAGEPPPGDEPPPGSELMVPAPGQGCLALEARGGDREAAEAAASITDPTALIELTAERAAVSTLGASCHTPVGIHARLAGGQLAVEGYAGLPDGSEWVHDRVAGDPEQPAALGEALAERMRAAGAAEILERAESGGVG